MRKMTDVGDRRVAGQTGRDTAETRLRALGEIGRAATSPPAEGRLRRVVAAARVAAGAASASLGVWQPDAELLKTVVNDGDLAPWEESEPADEVYPADQSTWLTGMAQDRLGVTFALDRPETPAEEKEYLQSLGKHSSMSIPVLLAGQWWGEVYFTRTQDQPDYVDADIEWGAAIAAQVGAAIEAMDHLRRIDRLAHTDPLTGVGNRRLVDEWLDEALQRLATAAEPIALVVGDVNGLKRINDASGHDAGDRALQEFARILQRCTEALDDPVLARLGGDEFCIAVQGPDAARITEVAEEVARLGWASMPYGVSLGVVSTADAVGPVDNAGRLFRLADAAQYRAKRTASRHPVIAGRSLPVDASQPLDLGPLPEAPERRMLRGRGEPDALRLLEAGLRALDHAAEEPVRSRLSLVADLVVHHVDGVGWWLSLAPGGASYVRTLEFAIYRAIAGLRPEDLQAEVGYSFELDRYPLTRQALSGGAHTVRVDDPGADAAEVAILDGLSATAMVCAGGVDDEGDRWLVEVFTDELSGHTRDLVVLVRVLVLAALHPTQARDEMSDQ